MELFDCILGRRTTRRFGGDPPALEELMRMVDAGRYAPSGYNKQPVRFAVIRSPDKVAEAFEFTGWLTGRPPEGERPTAYVAVLNDNDVMGGVPATHCAAYAVMLAAWSMGYGSCWHGVGSPDEVREFLGVGPGIEPRVLVSLGRPAGAFRVEDPSSDWKVRKEPDGTVRLGKLGRDEAVLAVL